MLNATIGRGKQLNATAFKYGMRNAVSSSGHKYQKSQCKRTELISKSQFRLSQPAYFVLSEVQIFNRQNLLSCLILRLVFFYISAVWLFSLVMSQGVMNLIPLTLVYQGKTKQPCPLSLHPQVLSDLLLREIWVRFLCNSNNSRVFLPPFLGKFCQWYS